MDIVNKSEEIIEEITMTCYRKTLAEQEQVTIPIPGLGESKSNIFMVCDFYSGSSHYSYYLYINPWNSGAVAVKDKTPGLYVQVSNDQILVNNSYYYTAFLEIYVVHGKYNIVDV